MWCWCWNSPLCRQSLTPNQTTVPNLISLVYFMPKSFLPFFFSSCLSLLSELLLFGCLLPSPASPGQNIIAKKGSGESCSPRKGSIKHRLEWPRYKPLCYRHCNLSSWLVLVFNYSFPQQRNLFAFQYPDWSFLTCKLSLFISVLLWPSKPPFSQWNSLLCIRRFTGISRVSSSRLNDSHLFAL